jgi:hypothetical protein
MRNGGIGAGWYEDDPNAIKISHDEMELQELFNRLLKGKIAEIYDLAKSKKEFL